MLWVYLFSGMALISVLIDESILTNGESEPSFFKIISHGLLLVTSLKHWGLFWLQLSHFKSLRPQNIHSNHGNYEFSLNFFSCRFHWTIFALQSPHIIQRPEYMPCKSFPLGSALTCEHAKYSDWVTLDAEKDEKKKHQNTVLYN